MNIHIGECQQVVQGVEGGLQAKDEGVQLVLTPCGPDDPGVGRQAWGLECQAQVIAQVCRMRYYLMCLAPVVDWEVGIPLEHLQVNLDKAGRLSSQHRDIDEYR